MSKDNDDLALNAIRQCATTLRELSGNKTIPAKWRKWLEKEMGAKRSRGRPIEPTVTAREEAVAARMLDHYLALEKEETKEGITAFAEQLADEYQYRGRNYGVKEVFTAFKKHRITVMAKEIARRLAARDAEIEQKRRQINESMRRRIDAGEPAEIVVADTVAALKLLNSVED